MQNLTQIGNQTFYHVLSSEIENLAIEERNVLLFAVNSFSEGIQLAVKSHRVVDNVICFCDDKSLIDFSNISEE